MREAPATTSRSLLREAPRDATSPGPPKHHGGARHLRATARPARSPLPEPCVLRLHNRDPALLQLLPPRVQPAGARGRDRAPIAVVSPQAARLTPLGGRRGYAPCRGVSAGGGRAGGVFVRIIPAVGVTAPASRASRSGTARAGSQRCWALLASAKNRLSVHSTTECRGDSHGRGRCQGSVGRVLAVLRDAGRAEGTVRRQQAVLDRFAAFLAGRGLDTASDRVCIDFIANQTGVRLGSLRESVKDRDVQAVRRPVVLMADVLAGRAVEVDRSVVPAKDGCPARFRPLRDDYLASCRRRGNAGGDRGRERQGGQPVLGLPGRGGRR